MILHKVDGPAEDDYLFDDEAYWYEYEDEEDAYDPYCDLRDVYPYSLDEWTPYGDYDEF